MRLMVGEIEAGRKSGRRAQRAHPRSPGIPCTTDPCADLPSRLIASHTVPMDELEKLRKLVGPEADGWTTAQLERLRCDIGAMAALLLDLYRSRRADSNARACGSPNFDVQQSDR